MENSSLKDRAVRATTVAVLALGCTLPLRAQSLFVANSGSNDIVTYRVGSDGSLASLGAPVLPGAQSLAVHPNGRIVYGIDFSGSNIVGYRSIPSGR